MALRKKIHDKDQDYARFYKRRLSAKKKEADMLFAMIMAIALALISYLLGTDSSICLDASNPLLSIPDPNNAFLAKPFESLCIQKEKIYIFSYTWIAGLSLRILTYAVFKFDSVYRLTGLKINNKNGRTLTVSQYARLIFLEWLPLNLGVAYLLLIGLHPTLFNLGVFSTAVILTQLVVIDLIPVSESLDFEVTATEKVQTKIQKEYQGKYRKFLAVSGIYFQQYGTYVLLAFFIFCFIQIIRVPPLDDEYYPSLYGAPEPVWGNNAYFAFEGLTAPAEVKDFYDYGRRLSIMNFEIYEELKKLSRLDAQYLYDVPELSSEDRLKTPVSFLKIDTSGWKNLACLYSLEENVTDCASFADLQTYIQNNQILWDRYSRIIQLGYDYSSVPQTLAGGGQSVIDLSRLEAAHIIYLADHGQQGKAMEEWLAHMRLFRQMAASRDDMVFKAALMVRIRVHLDALDKLLYVAPILARTYEDSLNEVLTVNQNAFRQDHMLADDWGFLCTPSAQVGQIAHHC